MTIISGTEASGESRKAWSAAAYVQDDWKVSSRLTLNLGARYDIHEFNNNCCVDQNRVGQILRTLGNPNGFGPLPKTDTNNIAPRVGVAWDVNGNGKNVARASFGLFYGTGIITSVYASDYQSGPVLYLTKTLTTSTYGVGQLANYVYGVSPLPDGPGLAPSQFPAGGSTAGNWLDPNFKDPLSANYAAGFSHAFTGSTVLSVDYTHVRGIQRLAHETDQPALAESSQSHRCPGPAARGLDAVGVWRSEPVCGSEHSRLVQPIGLRRGRYPFRASLRDELVHRELHPRMGARGTEGTPISRPRAAPLLRRFPR